MTLCLLLSLMSILGTLVLPAQCPRPMTAALGKSILKNGPGSRVQKHMIQILVLLFFAIVIKPLSTCCVMVKLTLTPDEVVAYMAGYDDNEESGDKKQWY